MSSAGEVPLRDSPSTRSKSGRDGCWSGAGRPASRATPRDLVGRRLVAGVLSRLTYPLECTHPGGLGRFVFTGSAGAGHVGLLFPLLPALIPPAATKVISV